jgi:hypothetical protein
MNEEAQTWIDLNNVVIEGMGLGRPLGAELIETVNEDIQFMVQTVTKDGPRAFISGERSIWQCDGTDVTTVNTNLFTAGGLTTLESWGGWILATNNIDVPQVRKDSAPGATFGPLTITGGNFTKCKQFIRRQPYVMAVGTDTTLAGDFARARVRWCSDDNVEMWEPKPENTAGDFEIRDVSGEIQGACPLGDATAIYSNEAVTIASYIGPPYVFSFVTTLRGFGIYGPKAVCAVGRLNYGIGPQGVFQTDGYSYQLLGDDNFRRWLKDNVDASSAAKRHEITCLHNEFTDTVHFCFPVLTGGYRMLYWKLDRQKFTWGDLRCNAAVEREVFSQPIVAVGKDVCWLTRDVITWDGAKFTSTMKTKLHDAGEVGVDKFLDHIFLNGQIEHVDIEVLMEDMDQRQWEALRKQDSERQNFVLQEAQKIQLTLTSSGSFHISRIRFYGEVGAFAI